MNNKFRKFLTAGLLMSFSAIWFSCDDNVPTKSATNPSADDTNKYISMSVQPMATDDNGYEVVVGEDLVGDDIYSQIVITVFDLTDEQAYVRVSDREVNLTAHVLGLEAGSFTFKNGKTTDELGNVIAYYHDSGAAFDNISTQLSEGVIVSAELLNEDGTSAFEPVASDISFDVIDSDVIEVAPYRMIVTSSTDVIYVDGGVTKSDIKVRMLNNLSKPLKGLLVQFSVTPDTLGILSAGYGVTDNNGEATIHFEDIGDPDAIGTAVITASFDHPVFGTTQKTKQISVIQQSAESQVNLYLYSQAVVGSNHNFSLVGEDVVDDDPNASSPIRTIITAVARDENNAPVTGKLVEFTAFFGGTEGDESNFDLSYLNTDANGIAWVYFLDNGMHAVDDLSMPGYEGVTIVANIDEVVATTQFNVYESMSDVWPYRLNLTKDRDYINLSEPTKAELTAVLSNQLNKPLEGAKVTFSTTKGWIDDFSTTDSTGTAVVYFDDLGDPGDVGVSTIEVSYQHAAFGTITDEVQISIMDPSTSGIPAYIVIPPSYPGDIMVTGGGGQESTNICAEVFDENGLLVDQPTTIQFQLGPQSPAGLKFANGAVSDSAMTSDGIACVSLNSGTEPGPVYISASVAGTSINATAIPVIVVTGPAFNIFPDLDVTSTEPIGGGFYQMEAAALVHDVHGNPVADSTYVYWTIEAAPNDADSVLDVQIIGVSHTNNENINGDSYSGMAFTKLIYPSRGIFDWARVKAYTYGALGTVILDSIENDAIMAYYGDNLMLVAGQTFHDFTVDGTPIDIVLQATLTDHYGNAVQNGRIQFFAPAGQIFGQNPGVTDENGQAMVSVRWTQAICPPIPNSDPVLYEDFTSSCGAVLIDPQMVSSDPVDILFIRSFQGRQEGSGIDMEIVKE